MLRYRSCRLSRNCLDVVLDRFWFGAHQHDVGRRKNKGCYLILHHNKNHETSVMVINASTNESLGSQ